MSRPKRSTKKPSRPPLQKGSQDSPKVEPQSSGGSEPLEIDLGRQAIRYINALPARDQAALAQAIESYRLTQKADVERLSGYSGWLRLRVGNHRVVFCVREDGRMEVPLVADRKEIYRLVKQNLR